MDAELRSMNIRHEGLSLKVYRCPTGHLTIGIGHNIEAHPLPEEMKAYLDEHGSITEEMAFRLLDLDMERVAREARGFDWFPKLSDRQKRAVQSMIFQMGMTKFRGFKRTIALLAQESYSAASIEMLNSVWAKQTPERAREISQMIRERF